MIILKPEKYNMFSVQETVIPESRKQESYKEFLESLKRENCWVISDDLRIKQEPTEPNQSRFCLLTCSICK